jgi:hypothetical protein
VWRLPCFQVPIQASSQEYFLIRVGQWHKMRDGIRMGYTQMTWMARKRPADVPSTIFLANVYYASLVSPEPYKHRSYLPYWVFLGQLGNRPCRSHPWRSALGSRFGQVYLQERDEQMRSLKIALVLWMQAKLPKKEPKHHVFCLE